MRFPNKSSLQRRWHLLYLHLLFQPFDGIFLSIHQCLRLQLICSLQLFFQVIKFFLEFAFFLHPHFGNLHFFKVLQLWKIEIKHTNDCVCIFTTYFTAEMDIQLFLRYIYCSQWYLLWTINVLLCSFLSPAALPFLFCRWPAVFGMKTICLRCD